MYRKPTLLAIVYALPIALYEIMKIFSFVMYTSKQPPRVLEDQRPLVDEDGREVV